MGRYYCDYCGHEFSGEDEGICPYCAVEDDFFDDEGDFGDDDYERDEHEGVNGYPLWGSA